MGQGIQGDFVEHGLLAFPGQFGLFSLNPSPEDVRALQGGSFYFLRPFVGKPVRRFHVYHGEADLLGFGGHCFHLLNVHKVKQEVNKKKQWDENIFPGPLLARIAEKHGLKGDAAIGAFFGLSRQAVGNWRRRQTVDFKLLLEKLPNEDLNWLFKGSPAGLPARPSEGGTISVDEALKALYFHGHRVQLEPLRGITPEV